MTEKPERPASLQRRRPRPAPDEHIDPVNYTPSATSTAEPSVVAPKRGRACPRREPTIQLGVRVTQDVSDLIEDLTEHDGTARAVIENAVRVYAQHINR